jgi:hypothetical protein
LLSKRSAVLKATTPDEIRIQEPSDPLGHHTTFTIYVSRRQQRSKISSHGDICIEDNGYHRVEEDSPNLFEN